MEKQSACGSLKRGKRRSPGRLSHLFHGTVTTASEIRYLPGRLRFGGCKHSAPFPSAVAIWRPSAFKSAEMQIDPKTPQIHALAVTMFRMNPLHLVERVEAWFAIGATSDGKKEFVGLADGVHESALSWRRGISGAVLLHSFSGSRLLTGSRLLNWRACHAVMVTR